MRTASLQSPTHSTGGRQPRFSQLIPMLRRQRIPPTHREIPSSRASPFVVDVDVHDMLESIESEEPTVS